MNNSFIRVIGSLIGAVLLVMVVHVIGEFLSKPRPVVGPGAASQVQPEPEAKAEAPEQAGDTLAVAVDEPVEEAKEESADETIEVPVPEEVAAEEAITEEAVVEMAAAVSGDAAAGERVARKCVACHTFDKGGANKVGPNLFGIFGKQAGTTGGYKYSDPFLAAAPAIGTWGVENLNTYLTDPTGFLREVSNNRSARSKMTLKLSSETERADVTAYLATLKD